jgi:hypothetical protein
MATAKPVVSGGFTTLPEPPSIDPHQADQFAPENRPNIKENEAKSRGFTSYLDWTKSDTPPTADEESLIQKYADVMHRANESIHYAITTAPVLVKAVKELQAEVDRLRNK